MKNRGFNKKKIRYRQHSMTSLQASGQPAEASVTYRILISCATDMGQKDTNQDYYGFRTGSETVTFDQTRTSFEAEYSDAREFVAAVADGVSMTNHPENPEEDAQAIAVKYLLNYMYYQFNLNQQNGMVADELNELVLNQSEEFGGIFATTISVIGLSDQQIKIMYLGDSPILHIHENKLNRITPLKQSNYLDEFLGNKMASGRDMATFNTVPLNSGDIWILATDGTIEAFTLPDGSLDSDTLLEIINTNPKKTAQELVRISGEKDIPGRDRKSADNRTAVVIRILEANHGR